jgi:glutathione S-transferase
MITVHHLNQSRSHRILWLLEKLDLPYEVIYYQREKNMLAPESLKRVHPLGKSPVPWLARLIGAAVGRAVSGSATAYT